MRRVLVTAGAGGIGREIVSAFLAAGDSIYTCDIDQTALDAAAAELPGLRVGRCDVGDPAQIEAMVADAVAQLGGLDVLVNNAGVSGPTAPVKDVPLEQWEQVLKVDLTGTFLVTKFAIPHLIDAGNGAIITMSSAAGRFGYPNRSPYSTVKWGLIGFMKTLAMELGEHGIRSNAILPGAVDGERIQRVFQGRADATGRPRLRCSWRPTPPNRSRARASRSMATCSGAVALVSSGSDGRPACAEPPAGSVTCGFAARAIRSAGGR